MFLKMKELTRDRENKGKGKKVLDILVQCSYAFY